MDPINNPQEGCTPTSSNCVIWQGPDIECINLCKGDNISVVVYKLAIELCSILDKLNVSTYDISCFKLGNCGPKEFNELIQLLIDKICALENITPISGGGSSTDALNATVNICSEFYYITPTGDTATTMTVLQYVLAIGNKVCGLVGQINTINTIIAEHESRIQRLENAPTPSTDIPEVLSQCVLPGTHDMDEVLVALEKAFCELRTYTGLPASIVGAMNAACNLNTTSRLYGQGIMSDIPGWFASPTNWAQSFSNLWKTVCDMRSAVSFIIQNCCASGVNAINLLMDVSLDGSNNLLIVFSGNIPSTIIDGATGSSIIIIDESGHTYTINNVNVKSSYLTPGVVMTIPLTTTPINVADIISVTLQGEFRDTVGGSTYSITLQDSVLTGGCPTVGVTPSYTSVDWAFTWPGAPAIVTVELLNGMGSVVQTQLLNITTPSQSGTFSALNWGSNYSIRLIINSQPCAKVTFTTDAYVCTPALLQATTYDYTNPAGNIKGNTIEAWQLLYDANNP